MGVPTTKTRLTYLDALRGIAILFMVVDHAYDWWLDAAGHDTSLAATTKFLGTLAAPLFLFLVGVGLVLSMQRAGWKGYPRRTIVSRMLRRGAELLI